MVSRVLAGAARARRAGAHDLRAARQPERRGRVPLRGCARPRDARRRRDAPVPARAKIQKLGMRPLTSMFLRGENGDGPIDDYRPEVHDSDGLLIAARNGEWLWRPLENPRVAERLLVLDGEPARLRPAAARSRSRSLPGLRGAPGSAPERVGRAEGRLGRGPGRARRDPDRATRPTTTSSPTGCPTRRPSASCARDPRLLDVLVRRRPRRGRPADVRIATRRDGGTHRARAPAGGGLRGQGAR